MEMGGSENGLSFYSRVESSGTFKRVRKCNMTPYGGEHYNACMTVGHCVFGIAKAAIYVHALRGSGAKKDDLRRVSCDVLRH